MVLRGSLGQRQLGCDFPVRLSGGDQLGHVPLAPGEGPGGSELFDEGVRLVNDHAHSEYLGLPRTGGEQRPGLPDVAGSAPAYQRGRELILRFGEISDRSIG